MSGGLRVYVAAPYDTAWIVRAFHERLRAVGCMPVSHWATIARGPERLETMDRGEIRSAIEVNDESLKSAAVVVCLSRRARGGETYCEVTRALGWGTPVLWCGDLILSAYRPGVYLVTEALALDALAYVAKRTRGDAARIALAQYFRLGAERVAAEQERQTS